MVVFQHKLSNFWSASVRLTNDTNISTSAELFVFYQRETLGYHIIIISSNVPTNNQKRILIVVVIPTRQFIEYDFIYYPSYICIFNIYYYFCTITIMWCNTNDIFSGYIFRPKLYIYCELFTYWPLIWY